jgi:hypothetical protein
MGLLGISPAYEGKTVSNSQPPLESVRAPQGAVGWTPRNGFIYEPVDLPTRVTDGDYVLVVSDDGFIRGVTAVTTAPLVAVLRIEADVTELIQALYDIAEHVAQRLTERRGDS